MVGRKGNLAISIIANIISVVVSAFVSFIITKYVVETVGSTTYSFYPIAANFANYFSIIFISVNAMSARFITVAFVNQNEEDAKKYFTSVLFADICIALVLSLVLLVIIGRIEYFLNIPVEILPSIRKLFIYLLIMVIVNGICSVYIIAPYARNRMEISAIISIIDNITKLVFFLVLLRIGNFKVEHYGLVLLVAAIVNLVLNYFATKVLLPGFKLDLKAFSFDHIKEVVSSGFWIMISRSGVLLINNAQLIVVNMTLGADASGPLSITQPIYTFISLFGTALVNTLTPLVVRTVAKEVETFNHDVRYIQLIIALLIGGLCTIVMGFGEQFYHLWLPKEDAGLLYQLSYFNIFQLLIIYLTTFYTAFLTAVNKVKVPSIVMLVIGIFGIGLMFIIMKYTNLGIIGMLVANCITYFVYYFVFQTLYAKEECNKEHPEWKPALNMRSILVTGILFLVCNTVLGKVIPINGYVSLIIICGIIVLVEVVGLLLIHKVNIKEFIAFVRR